MEETQLRTAMSRDVLRRNEIEERYHDEWAKEIDASGLLVPGFFESPTAIDNQYILEQIGSLEGSGYWTWVVGWVRRRCTLP